MGTMLYARGFGFDECYDALNLKHPEVILDIHRQYAAAGADILETNTFGANAFRLAAWNLESSAAEINTRGVELARQAARDVRADILIAGAVGPLGVHLAPLGNINREEAYRAFYEQIGALAEAGADLLILETFSDLAELEEALRAAKAACNLPVVAQMTFNREQRTFMGVTPLQAVQVLTPWQPALIGANCSTGPRGVLAVVRQMAAAAKAMPEAPGLSAMPNAGFPEARGSRVFYPATPEYFAEYTKQFIEAGARLVGGCCGTTPAHVRAMRAAFDKLTSSASTTAAIARVEIHHPAEGGHAHPHGDASIPTTLAQALAEGRFVTTVEVEPPKSADTSAIEETARMLKEAGATVLDISDIPMARMRMTGMAAAYRVQAGAEIETVLHFPVRGRNLLRVQGDLLAAHALGIRNIFVTMGDPTRIGDYPQANDHHDIVPTGLVQMIKEQFNIGLDGLGASIGKPCSFFVGVAANLTPTDFEKEAKLLRKKIECGADFALTQPVFDAEMARRFIAYYEQMFGKLTLPILAGILPLASVRHAQFLRNEVPGVVMPETIVQRLAAAGNKTRTEGAIIAMEILAGIRDLVQGAYFIPAFGRYDIVAKLIQQATGQLQPASS
ncbi:MAG: bifunctional homocysteine S-methyltransferase/methylenetetrahydrofolate reductase [Candidatus Roseilinea sp.]|nr:MAG: bifunctional homocysteine S-methyltransferase/methylenetetrahydrofolate reductase [Candidatus Roseilinea sp.]